MIWLGVDPGATGGIARLGDGLAPYAWKMPDTERDLSDLFRDLSQYADTFCSLESGHSMPQQGVTSSFSFGRNYGFLRGMLIAHHIPFEEVTPLKWQKALACQTHGNKNISKAKAQQLFPGLKITHAIADALLIAEFCRRTYAKIAS